MGEILDAVLFPVLSKIYHEKGRVGEVIFLSIQLALVLMTSMGIFLAVYGEELITLVYGDKWSSIVFLFQILCLGAGLRTATRIADVANRALGRLRRASLGKFMSAVFILVSVYLVSGFGLESVSTAVLVGNLTAFLIASFVALSGMDLVKSHVFLALLKAVFCSACIAFFIVLVRSVLKTMIGVSIGELFIAFVLTFFALALICHIGYRREIIHIKKHIIG